MQIVFFKKQSFLMRRCLYLCINRHKCPYWSDQNHHWMQKVHAQAFTESKCLGWSLGNLN